MLEVIQHEQHLGPAQSCRQGILRRGIAGLHDAGGARHGCRHQIRVRDRGQWGEDDAVGKVRADLSGEGQSEGRLPDAAGAGQGEEANVGTTQEPEGQCQLTLAANERVSGTGAEAIRRWCGDELFAMMFASMHRRGTPHGPSSR